MNLALVKLPFILVSVICFQKTTTPPNPPPGPDEIATSTRLEIVVRQRVGNLAVRVIFWLVSSAEIMVILASQLPESAFSQKILRFLVLSGSAQDIRPTTLFIFGVSLTYIGSYIRWSCFQALGKMFTFEMSILKNHRLITTGPYSIVRHPAYTGVLLTQAGIMCWHASPGSWLVQSGVLEATTGKLVALSYIVLVSAIIAGLLFRMSKEDVVLKKTFGKEWNRWAENVPYKLVPGII